MTATKQQDWRIERGADNIVWLYFDKANANTNTLSLETVNQLNQQLDIVLATPPKGLVILSAKENGFIAGADVEEFSHLDDILSVRNLIAKGQQVFDRIEKLKFPVVCLIEGYCLGGGLELALACRYRVADDSNLTRLGLPEVMLGIYPGWGGVKRLPKLIGAPQALDMMLTGRTIDARRAQKIGLVDYAVPKRQLKNAARHLITNQPAPHSASFLQRLSNAALMRPLLAMITRKKVAQKARPEHYPAPFAILDLWVKYRGDPLAIPEKNPGSLMNLLRGSTAKNLIRVFFLQERLKSLGKASDFKAEHVHVVGAGVMGGDIAAWCALRGLRVTLQDQTPERIAPALKRAVELFKSKLKQPREIQAAMDRLIPDVKGEGVLQADLVIEAIFENLEAKQQLFQKIEAKLKPGAFMATNTSSIPLEKISEGLQQPDKLIGLHFFNPVAKMMLVEIVIGKATDRELVKTAASFVRQIDKLPLPVKSAPGFLVNRILVPYMMEAINMTVEGIKPETIDEAALQFGMPMGPIELADTVGLDISLAVGKMLSDPDSPSAKKLEELVKAGRLGKKSGEGFYKYKNGKVIKFPPGKVNQELIDRLIQPLLIEAEDCLQEKIVDDADLLDAGVIFGTGFAPFRGGPKHYLGAHPVKKV